MAGFGYRSHDERTVARVPSRPGHAAELHAIDREANADLSLGKVDVPYYSLDEKTLYSI
jgi:hypothetical protein